MSQPATIKTKHPDYQNSSGKQATEDEVATYNIILADKGKEAADDWLNELWA